MCLGESFVWNHCFLCVFLCLCVACVCVVLWCGILVSVQEHAILFFCMFVSFRQVHLFVCSPASLSAMAWLRDNQCDLDVALQKFADSARALARALQACGRLHNGQLRAIADLIRLLLRWIWRDSRADTLIRAMPPGRCS